MPSARLPNIVISGNPGVGKTTLAKRLADEVPLLTYLDFGAEAIKRGCHDGWDEELNCHIVDFEELAKQLSDDELQKGGCIVDWIHADFWPLNGLVSLVVTVACNNTVLYDRYVARDYDRNKINENLDSEIMQGILEENRAWFEPEEDDELNVTTLVKFQSDTDADMDKNLEALKSWVSKWQERHPAVAEEGNRVNGHEDSDNSELFNIRRVSMDESSA